MTNFRLKLTGLIVMMLAVIGVVSAQTAVEQVCAVTGIQTATADFQPSGIVLTNFDNASMWVYDIERATRYPLPDTVPCVSNCRLSQDALWMTYYDAQNNSISKMHLTGTDRSILVNSASDVEWWSKDRLLVWTTINKAYLMSPDGSIPRENLPMESIVSVQHGGYWAVKLQQIEDSFQTLLVNLQDTSIAPLTLGSNTAYINNLAWSPDGQWLAYVGQGLLDTSVGVAGGEIFAIHPENGIPEQWTYLSATYGAVRINGHDMRGLSWSPDNTKLAFWVMEILGSNMESNVGQAVIHVLDVNTKEIRAYCGFSTNEHTPNPPALVWSPDSSHIAFAGNIPGDDKGYLLLALNIADGGLTELSDGVFPAYGSANVIAWGYKP